MTLRRKNNLENIFEEFLKTTMKPETTSSGGKNNYKLRYI